MPAVVSTGAAGLRETSQVRQRSEATPLRTAETRSIPVAVELMGVLSNPVEAEDKRI
jgi:hypothetical protein